MFGKSTIEKCQISASRALQIVSWTKAAIDLDNLPCQLSCCIDWLSVQKRLSQAFVWSTGGISAGDRAAAGFRTSAGINWCCCLVFVHFKRFTITINDAGDDDGGGGWRVRLEMNINTYIHLCAIVSS